NAIRGGLPVTLTGGNTAEAKVFWLYSRKHGDLERDYNDFYFSPSYYSQGNGNFRDICQNRRSDLWFNPELRDGALHYFWNLVQLDGYNPLVVQGIGYCWEDADGLTGLLPEDLPDDACRKIRDLVTEPFAPGKLWHLLVDDLRLTPENVRLIFETVIGGADQVENAVPGEGYWIDHWVYLLDLLEVFLSIYPDDSVNVCLLRNDYIFYDNWNVLGPLRERYTLVDGTVRRKNSVRVDPEKQGLITARKHQPHAVRINHGQTDTVYRTNLLVKMLTLALNKLSSFDPFITGLEMDAGRPGWCDAVNGLPGILGSSVSEVFALKRLLDQIGLISGWLASGTPIVVPVEVSRFFEAWNSCWENPPCSPEECFTFWEQTQAIRDAFLAEVRLGVNGRELELSQTQLQKFLEKAGVLVNQAISKAYEHQTGLYHTYFYYNTNHWQLVERVQDASEGQKNVVFVHPLAFEQCTLPHFLEGQVCALRNINQRNQAENLYQAVRASSLFDGKLKMYKVCDDLSGASDELGRIRVFPRGWLENESIFLHMEYKYLLELIRAGLIKEFYAELPQLAVCFLKPERYGRNPVENVSFIVSSAYLRETLHGNGVVARLSGSTAEMLHIWLWLSFGARPFRLNPQNQLELVFEPLLTADLFSKDARTVEVCWANNITRCYELPADSYCVKFLNRTLVVYFNPKRRDTFGPDPTQIRRIELTFWDSHRLTITNKILTGEIAVAVRQGRVERIDLLLE
ncbi:MAG TPA: hypothetical protein VEC37_05070, partial [Bacillota bacterium]|nr:hypothetical protein [Bacillota bacterium]